MTYDRWGMRYSEKIQYRNVSFYTRFWKKNLWVLVYRNCCDQFFNVYRLIKTICNLKVFTATPFHNTTRMFPVILLTLNSTLWYPSVCQSPCSFLELNFYIQALNVSPLSLSFPGVSRFSIVFTEVATSSLLCSCTTGESVLYVHWHDVLKIKIYLQKFTSTFYISIINIYMISNTLTGEWP